MRKLLIVRVAVIVLGLSLNIPGTFNDCSNDVEHKTHINA